MKNVTLSMSESLLYKSREYARAHGTTLNQLVRDCLEEKVGSGQPPRIARLFSLADEMGVRFDAGFLTREEANERC